MNVCTKITDPSFFDSEEIKGTEKKSDKRCIFALIIVNAKIIW
jgi:hypothetical protein